MKYNWAKLKQIQLNLNCSEKKWTLLNSTYQTIFCVELEILLPSFGFGFVNTSAFSVTGILPFDVDWARGSSLTFSTGETGFLSGSSFSISSRSGGILSLLEFSIRLALFSSFLLSLLELSIKLVRIRFVGDGESVRTSRRRREVAGWRSWEFFSWKNKTKLIRPRLVLSKYSLSAFYSMHKNVLASWIIIDWTIKNILGKNEGWNML